MREHGLHQPPSDVVGVTVVGVTVIRYRQPPDPLLLTVPAAPENLATVRDHLRRWLTLTGVDTESSADALLAVGEAASNAAEHAATGARRNVDLTVTAAVSDGRLRFTVSDNGCWRAPPEVPSSRGHGIRLIRALVDDVELITTEQGTTVTMVKEIRGQRNTGSRERRDD
ncbi:MAG: ATP-binding protein [Mycobacterium sp.]|nr:ATP-binding protein [Mycobacterium sp.]